MSSNTKISEETQEIEDLKNLCIALLKGVDLVSGSPLYIVQPFYSIVLKHKDTITKHKLFDYHLTEPVQK